MVSIASGLGALFVVMGGWLAQEGGAPVAEGTAPTVPVVAPRPETTPSPAPVSAPPAPALPTIPAIDQLRAAVVKANGAAMATLGEARDALRSNAKLSVEGKLNQFKRIEAAIDALAAGREPPSLELAQATAKRRGLDIEQALATCAAAIDAEVVRLRASDPTAAAAMVAEKAKLPALAAGLPAAKPTCRPLTPQEQQAVDELLQGATAAEEAFRSEVEISHARLIAALIGERMRLQSDSGLKPGERQRLLAAVDKQRADFESARKLPTTRELASAIAEWKEATRTAQLACADELRGTAEALAELSLADASAMVERAKGERLDAVAQQVPAHEMEGIEPTPPGPEPFLHVGETWRTSMWHDRATATAVVTKKSANQLSLRLALSHGVKFTIGAKLVKDRFTIESMKHDNKCIRIREASGGGAFSGSQMTLTLVWTEVLRNGEVEKRERHATFRVN